MDNGTEPPKIVVARARPERWLVPGVVAISLVLVLLGFGWWITRGEVIEMREELAKRVREASAEAREGRAIAQGAQDALREAQAKLGALDAKVNESQSQQLALESLYHELSRTRDEWLAAEVEQTIAIAAQQLQLAGNVQAALVALQSADARLARSDRPHFLPLRKVIARDIERLKAAPAIDVPGMTFRIDQVIDAVDQLPLLVDVRPPPDAKLPPEAEVASGWRAASRAIWDEIKSLVRVQRLDTLDHSLLPPESRYFLRENLKLRLLHARLALVQRDETAFRSDLKTAQNLLAQYFDTKHKAVTTAAATLAQLNDTAVNVVLPTIADSVSAVRNLKIPPEKGLK